jgi:hypothetical protein
MIPTWDIGERVLDNGDASFQLSGGKRQVPEASSLLKIAFTLGASLCVIAGNGIIAEASVLATSQPVAVISRTSRPLRSLQRSTDLNTKQPKGSDFSVARNIEQLGTTFRALCKPAKDLVDAEDFSIFD